MPTTRELHQQYVDAQNEYIMFSSQFWMDALHPERESRPMQPADLATMNALREKRDATHDAWWDTVQSLSGA